MDAYIVAGYRTAIGKAGRGGFRFMRPDDLAARVIRHLLSQVPDLDPARVDDLIVGNAVPEAEQGMQMGRLIALMSLPINVPGMIVNRYCGSGLEAIAIASQRIHAGMADVIIAGGTESMSLVPTMGFKTALNYDLAKDNASYFLGMGLTAERVSEKYGVDREAQDEFAYRSHQRALAAISSGTFAPEILPIEVIETFVEGDRRRSRTFTVDTDEGPRADTSLEGLAKLKPVFAQGGHVTAGNSSQTSDGAAFVMVVSERVVKELNLTPIGRLVSYAAAGVDPEYMGIGPVAAVPRALYRAGITLKDIEQTELNEAFAAQSVAVIRELDFDPETVNVNGGAIALGHPLGCSGAKLSLQLLHEMGRRNQKYGLVTACVGGGQGVAGVYERLN